VSQRSLSLAEARPKFQRRHKLSQELQLLAGTLRCRFASELALKQLPLAQLEQRQPAAVLA